MPPRSKHSARRPSKSASAKSPRESAASRRRAKTKALVVSDSVLREPFQTAGLVNPMVMFEPLRRAMIDRQIEFLGAAMAWSPAHILASQQAAFWDAFAGGTGKRVGQRKPAAGSRAKPRRSPR